MQRSGDAPWALAQSPQTSTCQRHGSQAASSERLSNRRTQTAKGPALIESWKKGYRRVVDLPKADADEILTFVMLCRILPVAWVASHIEATFPKSLGAGFTEGTLPLCEDYLRRYA